MGRVKAIVIVVLVGLVLAGALGTWVHGELRARDPAHWVEAEAQLASDQYLVRKGEAHIPVEVRIDGKEERGTILVNEKDAEYGFTRSDVGKWQKARVFRGMTGGLDVCFERSFETCQSKHRLRFAGPALGLAIVLAVGIAFVSALWKARRRGDQRMSKR
jgi:hypothetical protein